MRKGWGTREDAEGYCIFVVGTISLIAVLSILQWLSSQWWTVPLLIIVGIAGFVAFFYRLFHR